MMMKLRWFNPFEHSAIAMKGDWLDWTYCLRHVRYVFCLFTVGVDPKAVAQSGTPSVAHQSADPQSVAPRA